MVRVDSETVAMTSVSTERSNLTLCQKLHYKFLRLICFRPRAPHNDNQIDQENIGSILEKSPSISDHTLLPTALQTSQPPSATSTHSTSRPPLAASTRFSSCPPSPVQISANPLTSTTPRQTSALSSRQDASTLDRRSVRSTSFSSIPSSEISHFSQGNRERDFTRNRDIKRQGRSLVHSNKIVETKHLKERNKQFEELKNRPDDRRTEWNRRFPEGHVIVYTDGSATYKKSGYGVYMGPKHPLNISRRIDKSPHDADRAELIAATHAIRNIRKTAAYKDQPVILRTDSLGVIYVIKGLRRGPPFYLKMLINNSMEIQELREEVRLLTETHHMIAEHVHAHANDPGNEAADELARQATLGPEKSRSRSRNRSYDYRRLRSISNDPAYIRSHSVYIPSTRK